MDLLDYFEIVRRRKWVIVITTVLAVVAAGIVSLIIPASYSATSQLRLQTSLTGSVDYVRYDIQYTDRLINTYINIAQSKPFTDTLTEELNLSAPPEFELEAIANTELIQITFHANDAETAMNGANLLADLLIQHTEEQRDESTGGTSATLLDQLTNVEVELEQARTEYQELLSQVSEDTGNVEAAREAIDQAQLVLDNALQQYNQALNQTPQDPGQVETAQQAIDEAQLSLDQARTDHAALVSQYSLNSGRLEIARQNVQLKETTYSNLLQRYLDSNVTDEALRALGLYVVDPASLPARPDIPNLPITLAVGMVVGLAGGLGLAFLFERLDTTVYSTGEIEDLTRLSTLGQIPTVKGRGKGARLLERVAERETVRRFNANLFSVMKSRPFQTLLLTSSSRGEGKSTIVANLAISMAQVERTVCIIDTDIRRPSQHEVFNLPNEMGLSNVLMNQVPVLEAVQTTEFRGVHVLTSGSPVSSMTELLHPDEVTGILDELKKKYDIVLLDAPPYLAVADSAVLTPLVDAVVLVVGIGISDRENLQRTNQELAHLGITPIGTVVNRVHLRRAYRDYFDEIAKPVAAAEEIEALDTTASDLSATTPQPPVFGKILVVEDDESIALLIQKHLSRAGYELRVANEGRSALQIARVWVPDLVLLDLMLPNMDGIEVSRQLRQQEVVRDVPIIMLTALSTLEKRVEGFEAGADDYIVKPFDGTDLELRVAAQLRRSRIKNGNKI